MIFSSMKNTEIPVFSIWHKVRGGKYSHMNSTCVIPGTLGVPHTLYLRVSWYRWLQHMYSEPYNLSPEVIKIVVSSSCDDDG